MGTKRLWLALSALAGAVLLAGVIATILYRDKEGPVITVPDEKITYQEGEPTELLLIGATAWDGKDGDVTQSVIIERIIPVGDHTTANVIYAARDQSNNITTAVRTISYEELPEPKVQNQNDRVRREAAVAAAAAYSDRQLSESVMPEGEGTAEEQLSSPARNGFHLNAGAAAALDNVGR